MNNNKDINSLERKFINLVKTASNFCYKGYYSSSLNSKQSEHMDM
jgi:hypothetical protein